MDITAFLPPIGTLLTGVVVAVISARLTVRYALKRFYSEKWWERKVAAYSSIIEALHHVRNYADTNIQFSQRGKNLPEEGDKQLTEKLQNAMGELRKQWDMGNFIISDKAVEALNTLMQELENSTRNVTWDTHLMLKLEAVDNCLSSMRRIARTDLNLCA